MSWARLCPRTIQSGAKTRAGKAGRGNPYLKGVLGEAAAAAAKTDTFLGERYRRLVERRGKRKALVAVARSILVIVWHLLADPAARYHDLGAGYWADRIDKGKKARSHIRQLEALGFTVTLAPQPDPPSQPDPAAEEPAKPAAAACLVEVCYFPVSPYVPAGTLCGRENWVISGRSRSVFGSERHRVGDRRHRRPRGVTMTVRPVVTLRQATANDAPKIAEIWHQGWRDGHLGFVPQELVAARHEDSFWTRAAQRVSDATVAVVEGDVAGFVMVVGDEVEQVYVAAAHLGAGVADMLMTEAERQITRAGHLTAWLAVVAGNTRARRFYERRGWSDAGPFDYAAAGEDGPISVPARRYVKQLS